MSISHWPRQGLKFVAGCLCFSMLGIGGILFPLTVLPLMRLLPGGPLALRTRTRWVIKTFFRWVVGTLQASGMLRLDVRDLPLPEDQKGVLVLANHPSYLDVVVLISLLGESTCVVKQAVWDNPFFGRVVRAAGYIPATDPEAVLEGGARALRAGATLIIFPEGTRGLPGQPQRFQRGAAHIALRSGAPILPMVIICEPPILVREQRWFQLPDRTCHYGFWAQGLVHPCRSGDGAVPVPLAARHLTETLENLLMWNVHDHGRHDP